jgi:hypothetical protein
LPSGGSGRSDVIPVIKAVLDRLEILFERSLGQQLLDIEQEDVDADIAQDPAEGDHVDEELAPEDNDRLTAPAPGDGAPQAVRR